MSEITLPTKLGLSSRESEIYLALLHAGGLKLAQISKETGINRPALYVLLPKMITRGVVAQNVMGKQKIYVAEHPQKLEKLLEEVKVELGEALPDLERIYEGHSNRPSMKYFTGRKGITRVFEDVVVSSKSGETFYRYSSPPQTGRDPDTYLPKNYRSIRDEKQLERFVITGAFVSGKKKARLERAIKVLSEIDRNDFRVTTILYANKMAIVDYGAEVALVIESKAIVDFQKMIFRQLYKRL